MSRGDGFWLGKRALAFGLPADLVVDSGLLRLVPGRRLRAAVARGLTHLLVMDHGALGVIPQHRR